MSGRDDQIRELHERALKRPIGERAAFVGSSTRGDEDLERRVMALLAGQHDTHIAGYEPSADGASAVLPTGTQIDQYRIDGPLGAGGMGVVYRATDTKLNRPAAIKVLPESLADPEARRRFQREAQLASSLNHPHIVTVYDAGEYQERQYLITEYVDGGTLRQWAARPRGWLAIIELLIGVADAVAAAHEAGVLHRDIKPENILLAKNGYAKLADFGLAKLLEVDTLADDPFAAMPAGGHSTLTGTVGYMSPEQAEGRPLDGRSDVYSFGLVLHELLSGARPSSARMQRQGGTPELAPLPPEVPAELRTIVAKALEREPEDRYQTMHDLVVDLRRVVRRSGVDAHTPGPVSSPFEPVPGAAATTIRPRRAQWRTGLAVAAAAIIAIGSAVAAYYGLGLDAPPRSAVAVLPFVNESTADDLHISEGLGDDLRTRLMGLPGLDIQARASSVSFREPGTPLRTVADQLGVGVLVNGSLRRRGTMLIVLVEAMDANGTLLRSWPYQRPERELLALQQTISADVAAFLVPDSAPAAPTVTPSRESESANMLVLLGARIEQQVTDELDVDQEKLARAIDFYRRATEADPNSVAAHARLARALLYLGDVNGASEPLAKAQTLSESNPSTPAAVLSDMYYTSALYLLRARSNGIAQAYELAIRLNPNNTEALGAYAQWLMTHFRAVEADAFFRRALEHDRQLLSRYEAYAEYLAIMERMDRVREIGEEIRTRFPNDRGQLALARLYETTGDLDVGIAWGLRAYRANPDNPDAWGQVAELYARIGDFDTAAEFEPEPGVGHLWLRGDYGRLADEAGLLIIDYPEEPRLRLYYAFALNALNDSKSAISVLENARMVLLPGAEYMAAVEDEALTIYVDALQAVGGRDAEAQALAEQKASYGIDASLMTAWWPLSHRSCTLLQVGREAEAVDLLDRVRLSQGLAWTPLLRDSLCFRRVADEPRYQAVLDHLELRKTELRERLPATLLEYEVADVRPR